MPNYTHEISTPLVQQMGEKIIKLNIETVASSVSILDDKDLPSNVQKEVEKFREVIKTLQETLKGNATVYIVNSITERDALTDLITGDQCWVLDATDDSTVDSGGAFYLKLSTGTWEKVSEKESLDVTINWDMIIGRPDVSVNGIEEAVSAIHYHTNKDTLDKLDKDVNNKLIFNGKPISGTVYTNVLPESEEFISTINAMNLADGTLITIINKDIDT